MITDEQTIRELAGALAEARSDLRRVMDASGDLHRLANENDRLHELHEQTAAKRLKTEHDLEALRGELESIARVARAGHAAGIADGAVQWRTALERIYNRTAGGPMPAPASTREPGTEPA